jgi:phosphatidylglycerol---prolipoprotein diacylglyceryl transferase
MHPWLLQHPPISTYGACIVAALVAAWFWARSRAKAAAIDPSRIDLLMPLLLAAGLLGAYLFGLLTDALTPTPAHGTVLVGSLLLATAAGIAYALIARIPLGVLGDICAPPLALGIAIGRVGCFFAGCCFGKICEHPTFLTAVQFPPGSLVAQFQLDQSLLPSGLHTAGLLPQPVYPVQLYESLLCLLLAIAVWRWRPRNDRGITGQKFLAVGLGYALLRFPLEYLRADNPPIGGLTFSQWTAIVIALAAGLTWLVRWRFAAKWRVQYA